MHLRREGAVESTLQKQNHAQVAAARTPQDNVNDMDAADCVLDERTRRGKTEYLLRWTGYSAEHDSWTPRITPALKVMWEKRRRHRRWTRLLKALRIVRVRGGRRQREYLVKFRGFRELEWTPFVSVGLLQAWQRRRRRGRAMNI